MDKINGVLVAIVFMIIGLLFNVGCYFLQKDLYEDKKRRRKKK
jgi:hypothetical protein